jgi:DNA-binding HxlR family transcriptional regulator
MVLLDLLGRRWALRIIWELSRHKLSFRELQTSCGGISPTILNTRLSELREADIVALSDGAGFTLTPEGERLLTELMGLHDWAERWAKRRA